MEENKNTALEDEKVSDAIEETDAAEENEAGGEVEELKYEITPDGELSGLTAAQRKRAEIFDKITTGILAFLLCSPVLILAYILLWFIFKN